MNKKHYFCKYTKFICNRLMVASYILFFLSANVTNAYATSNPTEVTKSGDIIIKVANKPIKEVLTLIEQQSKFVFVYNTESVNLDKPVTLNITSGSINEIMTQLLKGSSLSYEISDRQILIFRSNQKDSKTSAKMLSSGTVLDENGEALIGVNVQVKGETSGTITDIDGKYSLNVPAGKSLVFSYVGYKRLEMKAQSQMKVEMQSDAELLNEVVVVGYGTMKKSDLTGSVSGVKAKDFNTGLVSSPSQLIQGRVAGVNITNNGGEPGGGVTIRVRGSNSIRSGQDPLYVVDGVPLDASDDLQPSGASTTGIGSTGSKNPLNFLNPDDIESIDILKDASATAIYGARGANGVIMITTKKGSEGQAKVSYSAYASVSELPNEYEVLSADQYRAFASEKGITIDDGGANTNWQDEIFRTALSHNHNLAVSGGGKKGNYRASLSFQDQEGIIKKSGMKKYTGRFI